MTLFPSVKTDLENAGARWHDREVIVDNGLITSRNPEDLAAFNKKVMEEIKEGVHTHARGQACCKFFLNPLIQWLFSFINLVSFFQ